MLDDGGRQVLVGDHLSTWARVWAALGATECVAVASSILIRPSPVVGYLPGAFPLYAAMFFVVGAVMFAGAATAWPRRRFGMFVFGIAATVHAVYAIGALGYSLSSNMSWVLATAMFTLAALNTLAAVKIAGPHH